MKTVFPAEVSGGKVIGLKTQDYLDKPSHDAYLKPKKVGDIG